MQITLLDTLDLQRVGNFLLAMNWQGRTLYWWPKNIVTNPASQASTGNAAEYKGDHHVDAKHYAHHNSLLAVHPAHEAQQTISLCDNH